MRSDHPRACGANKGAFAQTLSADGSSPRMRGKHLGADRFNQRGRIIPAHAEQTFPQLFCPVFCSDHPRACGANHGGRAAFHAIHGSSPRMRGKLGQIIKTETRNRIIPAHAGQTSPHAIMPPRSTDHPRACGANYNGTYSTFDDLGSSPRMRGKRQADRRGRGPDRIIPAHAGQTTIFLFNSARWSDHPRACGANPCRPPIRWMNTGSSPRMRGKRDQDPEHPYHLRIIPAHAGQTVP